MKNKFLGSCLMVGVFFSFTILFFLATASARNQKVFGLSGKSSKAFVFVDQEKTSGKAWDKLPSSLEFGSKDVLSVSGASDPARDLGYVPGEIVVKFKTFGSLTKEKEMLEAKGDLGQAAKINLTIAESFKNASQAQQDFRFKAMAMRSSGDLPSSMIALISDETTVEPVFKMLHEAMRSQKESEDDITSAIFDQLSQKRTIPARNLKAFDFANVYIFKNVRTDKPVEELAKDLSSDPNIEYAEPNYVYTVNNSYPNDPYFYTSGSWGQTYDDLYALKFDKLNAQPAWDVVRGSGVVVAVIDTGVDYSHSDIMGNMWQDSNGNYGYDFYYNDDDPMDGYGHGTHCAGTIAAVGNNNLGVIGVAPEAKIMAVKGFSDSGKGSDETLAPSIYYAANKGADILSNSWGGSVYSQMIKDAVDYAYYNMGCLVLASSGNSNWDLGVIPAYPACYESVIAVAATDSDDQKGSFSNYGDKIEVSAPGVGVLSLLAEDSFFAINYPSRIVGGEYFYLSGTSMACPHVAGVAALALSHRPELSNLELRSILRQGVDDIGEAGKDIYFGYGRVNALATLVSQPAPYYSLHFQSFVVDDSVGGNNNGAINPGESVKINFGLRNSSLSVDPLTDVSAVLTSQSPHVSVLASQAYYGAIATGSVGFAILPDIFEITVSADAQPGEAIPLALSVNTAQGYQVQIIFQISVSKTFSFVNIDAGLEGASQSSLAWGDFNNDGFLDLAVSGKNSDDERFTKVYRNDADGTFTDIEADLPGAIENGLVWGDFNNDGWLDLVIRFYYPNQTPKSGTAIFRNNTDGTFTDIAAGLPGTEDFSGGGLVAAGDFNNDGYLDVALLVKSSSSSADDAVRIFLNNGNGTFTDANVSFPVLWQASFGLGDFDNDGYLDIVMSGNNPSEGRLTRIYRNNGDSTFTDMNAGLTGVSMGSFAVGDFNNDGLLDLAMSGTTTYQSSGTALYIYKNNGEGVFTLYAYTECGDKVGSLSWGDFDNDGRLDLEVAQYIFRNQENGLFVDIGCDLPIQDVDDYAFVWGDFNQDGRLDLAMSGLVFMDFGLTRLTRIYRNVSNISANTLPSAPCSLTTSSLSNNVTLSWQKSMDGQTPSEGLSYNIYIGTAPGSVDRVSPMSDLGSGFRRVAQIGPQRGNVLPDTTSCLVKDLVPGTLYYWGVQAVDTSFAGSTFTIGEPFTIPPVTYHIYTDISDNYGELIPGATLDVNINGSVTTVDVSQWPAHTFIVNAGDNVTLTPHAYWYLFGPPEMTYTNIQENKIQNFVGIAMTPSQYIALDSGWNIMAFSIMPANANMASILEPLISQGIVQMVQDDHGGILWPAYNLNTIGQMNPSEGYKIKLSTPASLDIAGSALAYPQTLLLNQGWNIMGFPAIQEQEAITVLQPLIDAGQLIQVIDQHNHTISLVNGTWVNQIGNFKPGEGYHIKVNAGCSLAIQ